ncbi:hypothetical protein [Salinibacter altiplanensis]|uniref:hypothetical protein n=1 Tax=Salinibacter altiplanensis TaxID=1803181 RepID=UPI000C9F9428|nr:hypothetical protein [Salinibacter altiplanensis]
MRLPLPLQTAHYRLLAVLWTIGILVALTLPTGSVPGPQTTGLDKVVHAGLFAGFGVLWLRGLCPPDAEGLPRCFRRRGGLFFVGGLLFAVGTEVYQSLIPLCRVADPYDVTADLLGFVVAFVGYYVYHVRPISRASA